ncbi:FAD:protein FMN transferase [Planctomycetota bacterium]
MIKGDSGTRMLMGTFGRIQLWCESEQIAQAALDAAFKALDEIEKQMSTYRDDSELSLVNRRAAQEPVPVSSETYNLLAQAVEYSRMTEGAFDITVAPLLDLWKQAAQQGRPPSEKDLSEVREKVGYRKLILSATQQTVSLAVEGMEINVDAIAKGYAVDRALAAVRRPGVKSALVDIGGEIACFGGDQLRQNWIVGIQDLFYEENGNPLSQRVRWKVALHDCAIATSGNYRQYVTIGGQRYSHIIDPRTGKPAEKLPSVTVIAPRTEAADALATAVSVMGPEKGMALIESLAETEAFLVTGTREELLIHRSSGFEKFEIK